MDIAELLAFSVKNKASDLHLSAGLPPMIRVDGDVRRINIPALEHKQIHSLIYDIMRARREHGDERGAARGDDRSEGGCGDLLLHGILRWMSRRHHGQRARHRS